MLTLQLEPWDTFFPEAGELFVEHYKEIGQPDLEFSADATFYKLLEAQGRLQILTARKTGRMIGYCVMTVQRAPHYAALIAVEDVYFVTKAERKHGVGRKLIERSIELAKARGAKRAVFHSKKVIPHRVMFQGLGMTHFDELWMKVL